MVLITQRTVQQLATLITVTLILLYEVSTTLNIRDRLVGHNIINYDLRVIQKLYPYFLLEDVIDTLVLLTLSPKPYGDR